MFFSSNDLLAIAVTFKLAFVTTVILLLISVPLAWKMSRWTSRFKPFIEATVALPLVLPPTVLGFYLLIFLAPDSVVGNWWFQLTGTPLAFSFSGLVLASVVYSLPFVLQPLQLAFERLDKQTLECAQVFGATPLRRFTTIIWPSTRSSFLLASVLGFAHTVGEFGVVLMIGGNIPGETQVLSLVLYDYVESLDYARAHTLAGALLVFSMTMLLIVYSLNRHLLVRTSSSAKRGFLA